jgi:anti-sigma B factor antagonist
MADPPPEPGVLKGAIDVSHDGHVWILAVSGEHDLSTAPNLVHDLEAAFGAGGPVVVDLAEVEFMDSAILNALLAARERALARQDGSFALVAPPGSFASRVLALVVGTLIPTYPNPTDAAAAVAPAS